MMIGFGMGWLWLVVIGLVVWFVADAARRPTDATPTVDPLARLEERYARGEIDTDEFVARRRELERSSR